MVWVISRCLSLKLLISEEAKSNQTQTQAKSQPWVITSKGWRRGLKLWRTAIFRMPQRSVWKFLKAVLSFFSWCRMLTQPLGYSTRSRVNTVYLVYGYFGLGEMAKLARSFCLLLSTSFRSALQTKHRAVLLASENIAIIGSVLTDFAILQISIAIISRNVSKGGCFWHWSRALS